MKNLWQKVSYIGHKKLNDHKELGIVVLLNRVVVSGTLALGTFIPVAIFFNLPVVTACVLSGMSLAVLTLYINHRGAFELARIYFYFVCTLFITMIVLISGKDSGSQIAYILLGVLPLVLFRNMKRIVLLFICNFLVFGMASYWVETHQPWMEYAPQNLMRLSFYMNVISMITLLYFVTYYFKTATTDSEKIITEQKEELSQKNKDIMDSIHYAKRIQNSILSPLKVINEILPSSFVLYKPKDIVAGDFYWVHQEEDKIFFTVADCTGHGVPGALVSLVCSNALTKAVLEMHIHRPAEVLDAATRILEEHFSRSEEKMMDGMDLAFCMIDKAKNILEYAGANSPLYLIRNNELKEFKPDKQPVGKHEERKPFTNHVIQLEKDDSIYIFTDGYSDQFGGSQGKKFKYSQFKSLLHSIHGLPAREQQIALEKAIASWKGELEQVDDICVMGVRV
jgi:serine phosphatase RsbU (regulator of sigma subunit)